MREDYVRLSNGRYALAMGDAHCVVDPVNGQGANSASFSAWVIGHVILEDYAFDERFCRRVAREREPFVHGVSDWANLILNPAPHVVVLLGAMAQSKPLCDAYTRNFNHPDVSGTPSPHPSARPRSSPATRPTRQCSPDLAPLAEGDPGERR